MSAAPTPAAEQPTRHPLAAFGLDMLARGAARLRGERTAIVEAGPGADGAIAYRDLDRLALAFAGRAIDCGLQAGERLLVLAAPRIGVATAIFGALDAGLEPVIAPAHLSPTALAFLAQATGAAAVVGPTRFGDLDLEAAMFEIAASAPGVRLLGSLGPDPVDGAFDFSAQGLHEPIEPPQRLHAGGAAPRIGLIFAPDQKAPRATFVAQGEIVSLALELAAQLRLTGDRPILSTLSPASLAGLVAGPVAALIAGATLTWCGPFEAQGFVAALDGLGPCHLAAPAAIADDLARAGLARPGALESLTLAARPGETVETRFGCPVAVLSAQADGRLSLSPTAALETSGHGAHSS